MQDKPNPFETIERSEKGDKSGFHEFVNTPDFRNALNPDIAEFIFKANSVLKEFRDNWIAEHKGQWSKSLEFDVLPVMSDGMIIGYMGISEITGDSYDFFPAKMLSMNGEKGGDE